MDKKKCLKCGKEYQPKKETSKFCSTSCRVMWNRNKPKKEKTKDEIQPFQMQVLYNQMLEMMEAIGKPEFKGILSSENGTPTAISHTTKQALGLEKTFQQHMNEISGFEYEEEFKAKTIEIDAATNLSQKQKDLLFINMRKSNL